MWQATQGTLLVLHIPEPPTRHLDTSDAEGISPNLDSEACASVASRGTQGGQFFQQVQTHLLSGILPFALSPVSQSGERLPGLTQPPSPRRRG